MAVLNYEVKDNVAIVTLNRPEVLNAVNPELACRLVDTWNAVREDDNVRVVVVTGAGRAFCAGNDLGQTVPLVTGARPPKDEWDRRVVSHQHVLPFAWLRDGDCEKPMIAAVNGIATGGGCEMVQGTDIRVASTAAKFGLAEVKRGLMPTCGSTARLPFQVPYARAMEIMLTGDLISAEEALAIGLVNYVVPPDQLMTKAIEIAGKITANGPFAVKQIRASVRNCLHIPDAAAMQIEAQYFAAVAHSEDAIEGPKAFMEKRKPVYKGR
jgi:enoyl-CoA hydratase